MRSPARFLGDGLPAPPPPPPPPFDSDVAVVLAALLCALICVVGLALVARCAWLRRAASIASASSSSSSSSSSPAAPPPPPTPPKKGLKKKALRSLPTVSFDASVSAAGKLADCAICLAEFADGEEIRVLPQCGHGFHVGCVDTWLGSHSSCPSCRRILVVPAPSSSKCRRCSESPGGASSAEGGAAEAGSKVREDAVDADRFLP